MRRGGWFHLAARFVQSLRPRPLSPVELAWVAARLRPGEGPLFAAQPVADQRHGYESGRFLDGESLTLVRAALLHDVGKRHADLGVIGRVLATVAARFGIRLRGRWLAYLDHGRLAAVELDELGAESLVVAFARSHHGSRPEEIQPHEWRLLQAADRVRPGGSLLRGL